jgi:hypothetical protein
MNIVTDNSAIIETLSNRIVKLEAKIQTAQADKLAAIAIERKRWAREDLVALEILRLEQQAKALNDYAYSNKPLTKRGLNLESIALSEKADALKEPKP